MIEAIKKRIEKNQAELTVLQKGHDVMVSEFNRRQEEFNDRVKQNQNRFQQLAGAIAELELLLGTFEQDLNGQDENKLSELNRL